MGGMLKPSNAICAAGNPERAYEYQQAVDRQDAVSGRSQPLPYGTRTRGADSAHRSGFGAEAVERLRAVRAKRNAETWRPRSAPWKTRRDPAKISCAILAAVEANATVGEISDAMRKVYGSIKRPW